MIGFDLIVFYFLLSSIAIFFFHKAYRLWRQRNLSANNNDISRAYYRNRIAENAFLGFVALIALLLLLLK